MKIGVLGGTFDPPHFGHLALARAALTGLELDEILFVPAYKNPNKRQKSSPAKHRLAMLRLFLEGEADMAVSDLEIIRRGPSYALDTMLELQAAQPADYWFILGADALRDLPNWKQPEKLLRLCRIGVTVRPPYDEKLVLAKLPAELRDRIDLFPMPPKEISATDVRNRISAGLSASLFVAPQVLQYISAHDLYNNS